ncbi:MAG: metallophosphoesterase, partial [Clostridia bacterium]
MEETKILIVSDLHHTHHAGQPCPHPSRRGDKALDLLKKVLLAEKNNVHLLVLLGDLLDDGNLDGAMEDLMEIRDAVEKSGIPALALAGNHDGSQDAIADAFGTREGLYRMKGCSLMLFNDAYDASDRCARDRERMLAYLGEAPEGEPLIVFQHNPVHPAIDSPYPYNL